MAGGDSNGEAERPAVPCALAARCEAVVAAESFASVEERSADEGA